MIDVNRHPNNPILSPNPDHDWEAKGAYNGCAVKKGQNIYLVYRGLSHPQEYQGKTVELSTIGIASGQCGTKFNHRRQFIKPEQEWEKFGCEDPRVTYFNNNYYIFYTAISDHPPNRYTIKVGLAISPDLKKITDKRLVTPFNAKAMALFPEKINGKIFAILSAQTDQPPVNVATAEFKQISDIWNKDYWDNWLDELETHTLRLIRRPQDHVEVGAPPIKTNKGWLLIYSYINNYFNEQKRIFNIEAALLDPKKPKQVIGRSNFPLLIPEKKYEREGIIPEVVFPSGELVENDRLHIYYGGTDTYCCLATCSLKDLLNELTND